MKNQTYIYLALFGLFVAFGVVSFLVFITKGKNKYYLQKKLAIGAIIIGMTSVANGCRIHSTCYVPAYYDEPRRLYNTNPRIDKIAVDLKGNDQSVDYECDIRNNDNISFRISLDNKDVLCGNCKQSKDGYSRILNIKTKDILEPGNYVLKLYSVKESEIKDNTFMFYSVDLKVNEIDK